MLRGMPGGSSLKPAPLTPFFGSKIFRTGFPREAHAVNTIELNTGRGGEGRGGQCAYNTSCVQISLNKVKIEDQLV